MVNPDQYPRRVETPEVEEVDHPVPQEEAGLSFGQPPLELVVHAAALSGGRIPLPDGNTMQLVHLMTPAIALTIKLDENGKNALIKILTGGVEIVRPGSVLLP